MTSGASRLKAKQNRTFAARAQQRADICSAADRTKNTRTAGSIASVPGNKATGGIPSSFATCYARPKGRRKRIAGKTEQN